MVGSAVMSSCLASVSCRPSGQLLLQEDARGLVIRENPLPSAASENPHGFAVLGLCITLEASEQRQPLVAIPTTAGDDRAEPVTVNRAQLRHRGGLDRQTVSIRAFTAPAREDGRLHPFVHSPRRRAFALKGAYGNPDE